MILIWSDPDGEASSKIGSEAPPHICQDASVEVPAKQLVWNMIGVEGITPNGIEYSSVNIPGVREESYNLIIMLCCARLRTIINHLKKN